MSPAASTKDVARPDRRARRRQETIEEILDIAQDVMTEDGVAGLSLAEVARRLGVQPPSLYKYFPSLMAVYDALFERGSREHLEVMGVAMAEAGTGLAALEAGLDAAGRWCVENRAMAQLLFWRPVPSFEASPDAMELSIDMLRIQRAALVEAVAAGELGPEADSDEAVYLCGAFLGGVFTMAVANDPDLPWGEGRFTPLFAKFTTIMQAAYPPPKRRSPRR